MQRIKSRKCSGHCFIWVRAEALWAQDPGVYLALRCAHCGWISKLITKYKHEHHKLVSGSAQGYRNAHENGSCPGFKGDDEDEF